MKEIIAVIGRSGAGKDSLVTQASHKYKIPMVPSYTERPMRPNETNGIEHTFLSSKEMDRILQQENILAYTKINDVRYCVSKELLESLPGNKIFYTLDPEGIKYFEKEHPEYTMCKIYVSADTEKRKQRAIARNGDTETFINRNNEEDEQFTEFEHSENYDIIIYNNDSFELAQNDFNHAIEYILDLDKEVERE